MCMHGGLSPDIQNMNQVRHFRLPVEPLDGGFLCDLLLSDPRDDIEGWAESDHGLPLFLGPDVVTSFCEEFKIDLIVRSHEVVQPHLSQY